MDYTFSAADDGTLVVPVILETAGNRTITVSDTARPTARGTSGVIKVTVAGMDADFTDTVLPLTDSTACLNGVNPRRPGPAHVDATGNRIAGVRTRIWPTSP